MQLKISDLETERQWRSATGLSKEKFDKILLCFELSYQQIFQKTIQERTGDSPNEASITASEELLLFMLFSLKSGLTYDLLGRFAAAICKWYGRAVRRRGQMPKEIKHWVYRFYKKHYWT